MHHMGGHVCICTINTNVGGGCMHHNTHMVGHVCISWGGHFCTMWGARVHHQHTHGGARVHRTTPHPDSALPGPAQALVLERLSRGMRLHADDSTGGQGQGQGGLTRQQSVARQPQQQEAPPPGDF